MYCNIWMSTNCWVVICRMEIQVMSWRSKTLRSSMQEFIAVPRRPQLTTSLPLPVWLWGVSSRLGIKQACKVHGYKQLNPREPIVIVLLSFDTVIMLHEATEQKKEENLVVLTFEYHHYNLIIMFLVQTLEWFCQQVWNLKSCYSISQRLIDHTEIK